MGDRRSRSLRGFVLPAWTVDLVLVLLLAVAMGFDADPRTRTVGNLSIGACVLLLSGHLMRATEERNS